MRKEVFDIVYEVTERFQNRQRFAERRNMGARKD
jgi:hypothetical protein